MAYQRVGIGDNPGVNLTTMWTPQTGFLSTPGDIISSGGGGPAVFVQPNVVPVPACASDTQPGGAAFSQACINQVLAAQQQNMQLRNNANYNVDLQNCLNTVPQPPDCYQRTFGLTPTGGYTSDAGAGPGGSQLIENAGGQPVASPPPVFSATGAPNPYVSAPTYSPVAAPAPVTPPTTKSGASTDSGGGSTTQNYVDQATSFFTGDVSLAGSHFPIWGLVAAGAAALLLLGGHR